MPMTLQPKLRTAWTAFRLLLPVETTYGYNPVPEDASPELKQHIKGVQANLWTEYIVGRDLAFYQLLPRGAAAPGPGQPC